MLSAAVILVGLGLAAAITAGGLLVAEISGSSSAAGLGQTAIVLGAALIAIPLARISAAQGRRAGLSTGLLVGFLGTVLVVVGASFESIWVVLLGLVMFGGAQATVLQARFSATDLSPKSRAGRDLSLILWMSAIGAIIGPNIAGPAAETARAVGLPDLAGAFLWSAVGLLTAVVLVFSGLRPDPLLLAEASRDHSEKALKRSLRATWTVVSGNRTAALALVTLISANAAMVGLMVMTPLHLTGTGHSLTIVGVVISIHVAGMFLFAPVFGVMTDRIGAPRTSGLGLLLLIAAGLLAALAPDQQTVLVSVALFLLGLGWSMCVVSASSGLSMAIPITERASAQGFGDLGMGLAGALSGAAAGLVFGLGSYTLLGVVIAALVIPALVLSVSHPSRSA